MEFQVIKATNGDILVSDGTEVRRFSHDGLRQYRNVPTTTMFKEMGYIYPPITLDCSSMEEAMRQARSPAL